jgi:hypothetical protein
MDCSAWCALRKEVIETGEGVWFVLSLDTGGEETVRLHRVNVVTGPGGPAIEVVPRDRPGEVRRVPLASIRGMRPVRTE